MYALILISKYFHRIDENNFAEYMRIVENIFAFLYFENCGKIVKNNQLDEIKLDVTNIRNEIRKINLDCSKVST